MTKETRTTINRIVYNAQLSHLQKQSGKLLERTMPIEENTIEIIATAKVGS